MQPRPRPEYPLHSSACPLARSLLCLLRLRQVHRLNPVVYAADVKRLSADVVRTFNHTLDTLKQSRRVPGPFAFSDGTRTGTHATSVAATLSLWHAQVSKDWPRAGKGAAEPFFPPRPYKTLQAEKGFDSRLGLQLPEALNRQASFLHSLLRPCYLERPFLEAAVCRS